MHGPASASSGSAASSPSGPVQRRLDPTAATSTTTLPSATTAATAPVPRTPRPLPLARCPTAAPRPTSVLQTTCRMPIRHSKWCCSARIGGHGRHARSEGSPGSDSGATAGDRSVSSFSVLEARLMAEGVDAEVDDVTLAFAFDGAVERYALVAFECVAPLAPSCATLGWSCSIPGGPVSRSSRRRPWATTR